MHISRERNASPVSASFQSLFDFELSTSTRRLVAPSSLHAFAVLLLAFNAPLQNLNLGHWRDSSLHTGQLDRKLAVQGRPIRVSLMRVPMGSTVAPTVYSDRIDPAYLKEAPVGKAGALLEGIHADPLQHPLAAKVLDLVPEFSSWDNWYKAPSLVANGHVHTILAAKLRKTRAVKYFRELLTTPDGGTLALDLLSGLRRVRSGSKSVQSNWSEMLSSGVIAGANEDAERSDTLFVDSPPPLDKNRPLLVLLSGLGGGSQDTYVRSMGVMAAERGWQVAVLNMRACGSSPVTSPRLFSAYRGANDDVRFAVQHLRKTRLGGNVGGAPLAVIGWSNSGTILNNVLAEQATTHADPAYAIDAGASLATPFDMPTSTLNLGRFFHRNIYDRNLGKSLRTLWMRSRDQFIDPSTGDAIEVLQWDGLGEAAKTFKADDEMAKQGTTIRELDEALTRRQFGYASVDEYYADASSDQRFGQVSTPLLLMNAYDDPIVPGYSLARGLVNAKSNPNIMIAITSSGGHLGWCDHQEPWGSALWVERAVCGFLEAALELKAAAVCETIACEIFD